MLHRWHCVINGIFWIPLPFFIKKPYSELSHKPYFIAKSAKDKYEFIPFFWVNWYTRRRSFVSNNTAKMLSIWKTKKIQEMRKKKMRMNLLLKKFIKAILSSCAFSFKFISVKHYTLCVINPPLLECVLEPIFQYPVLNR